MQKKFDIVKSLKTQTRPPAELVINDETYRVLLNAKAAALANEILKKEDKDVDVVAANCWFKFSTYQLAVVLWASLRRHHADITLEQVDDWISPEIFNDLWLLLFNHAFPGRIEKINAFVEEAKAGETMPNPPVSPETA